MIDNNFVPVRYKQAKRKPLRILLRMACSSIPIILFALLPLIATLTNEAGEVVPPDPIPMYIALGLAAATVIVSFFASLAVYKSDGFCILEDGVSYDFTFIIKKNVKLPYEKINNVKVKRNIFERMLGLSTVSLNSGSGMTNMQSEISLTFNKDYAEYFADYMQKRSAAAKKGEIFETPFTPPSESKEIAPKVTVDTDICTVSKADKFRSIFTNDLLYLSAVFFIIILFCNFYFNPEAVFDVDLKIPEAFASVLVSLFITAIIMVFALIGTIIYTFIRYYDYKIYEKDGCLHISFGFINKHSVSVSKDKIRGYSLSQGLLRQLFGIASLKLIVVGINDMGNNNQPTITYLYPCGKIKKLQSIIDKYLPEFKFEGKPEKAGRFTLLHNFTIPAFWTTVLLSPILIITAIVASPYVLLVLPALLLFPLLHSLLLKKNNSLGLDKKLLYSTSGGFYKSTHIIRTNSVQEIRSYAGFIRRKQNICTYRIVYRGDNGILGNRYYIRNLPKIGLDEFN